MKRLYWGKWLWLILNFCILGNAYAIDFSTFSSKGYEGKGDLEFIGPEDLILGPAEEIIVADSKNNRIQILKPDGSFQRNITGMPQIIPDLASNASGTTRTKENPQATKQSGDEKKKQKSFLDRPVGLSLEPPEKLYVSAQGSHIIHVLNFQTGLPISTIGNPGRKQGELNLPLDIDVSPEGMLAVADFGNRRVQLFNKNGKFFREIHYKEETKKNQLRSLAPYGVLWLESGELLVSYPSFHQVVCWDKTGRLVWRYGTLGKGKGELNGPSFMSHHLGRNILISDSQNNRIVEITQTGQFVKQFSGRGSALGRVLSPKGLALTSQEILVVSDQGNNRIHFFQPGKTDLLLREAKSFVFQDLWDDALPKIEQVLNLDPNNGDARSLLVNALHFFGDRSFRNYEFEKAEEFYRRVLIYNPNDLDVQPKLDAIFWAENKDLIVKISVGIAGLIFSLIFFWLVKVTFNKVVFGHA